MSPPTELTVDKAEVVNLLASARDVQAIAFVCTFAENFKDEHITDLERWRLYQLKSTGEYEHKRARLANRLGETAKDIINQIANTIYKHHRMYTYGIAVELTEENLNNLKQFLQTH